MYEITFLREGQIVVALYYTLWTLFHVETYGPYGQRHPVA